MLSVFRPFGFQDGSNEIFPLFRILLSFVPLLLSLCLKTTWPGSRLCRYFWSNCQINFWEKDKRQTDNIFWEGGGA